MIFDARGARIDEIQRPDYRAKQAEIINTGKARHAFAQQMTTQEFPCPVPQRLCKHVHH